MPDYNVQRLTGLENLLFDQKGNLVGIQNPHGNGADLVPGNVDISSAGLGGVVYDSSNRVTEFTLGGKTWFVNYTGNQMVVSGASSFVATLDASGRFASVQ